MGIDACAFHDWSTVSELAGYLPDGWREVIMRQGDPTGPLVIKSKWAHRNPLGDKAAWAYPEKGMPGSSRELTTRQLLEERGLDRLVLGYDEGLLASAHPLHHLAHVVVSAANDWTAAEWLARDDRLFGLILVSTSMPDEAAKEIRRCAGNPRFVGVALGHNGLGRPFGHPVYHPIYDAAAEAGLPIVIQVGSEATADSSTVPLAGGRPQTYGEYHAIGHTPFLNHVTSFITQGVFESYPSLRLLLLGGGVGWMPSHLWRMDSLFSEVPMDAPWLTRQPSEYFLDHVRLSTYSLEVPPDPARLEQLLSTVPDPASLLVYASGYPNWDTEGPEEIGARLPQAWHDRVFEQNAAELFRWPEGSGDGAVGPAAPTVAEA
ncbi:MAG: amidohydrolase family protein [Solirubrobacterales bacterium]